MLLSWSWIMSLLLAMMLLRPLLDIGRESTSICLPVFPIAWIAASFKSALFHSLTISVLIGILRFVFEGLGALANHLLISEARNIRFGVNAFGMRKMARNMTALRQGLRAIDVILPEDAEFESARAFYALYPLGPTVCVGNNYYLWIIHWPIFPQPNRVYLMPSANIKPFASVMRTTRSCLVFKVTLTRPLRTTSSTYLLE